MRRHQQTALLALLCVSCGNKATPQVTGNFAAQTARPATSSPQTSVQTPAQARIPPEGKIQARAILLPAPATAEAPKPPVAHEAAATIPGAQRILYAAASPTAEEILVLAQMSQDAYQDTYSGAYFVVRLGAETKVETVLEGTNLTDPDAPVRSPDGSTAYFTFDNGSYSPTGNDTGHGLFAWEHGSGNLKQILKDSISGLAISGDGKHAGFWDYSAGNKLTVYNLQKRRVVRTWADQIHSADDLVIADMVFTPDGESLLARLFAPKEDPVMRYEISTGKISLFAKDVQSIAASGDSIYLLRFKPVPFTNPENPHQLSKWTQGADGLADLIKNFPFMSLSSSFGGPWLVGGSNGGYANGAAIYDTRTGRIQAAGKSCGSAVVTASGKILYVFGNELVANAAVCSGPPPSRAAGPE